MDRPKPKPRMTRTGLLAAVLLVVGVLLAAGLYFPVRYWLPSMHCWERAPWETAAPGGQRGADPRAATGAAADPAGTVYSGEIAARRTHPAVPTLADGGYSLTVLAVENPARPEWDPWYYPAPGVKLVAVEVVVGCVSCEGHRVHPLLFVLEDADGAAHMAELGALERHRQLAPTSIAPGQQARGRVAFELPEGAMPTRLSYLAPGVTLEVGWAQ